MVNRTEVLETLKQYFEKKGRVLTSQEYSHETDTPIRFRQVEAYFGNWKRLEKLLMVSEVRTDGAASDVQDVIRARNEAAYAASQEWKQASENQDVKARREAEAQAVGEKLAANAATPEGANANKIAIGGKLPGEQQDYTAMGATVKTDPHTLEQSVIDVEPEIVATANEDPRTPLELRDAVIADGVRTGAVPVGTATAGGSTGEASTDTVNALGADTADADKIKDTSTTNTSSTENTKVPADDAKVVNAKK